MLYIIKKVDNEHAKLSWASPNQYKAKLCSTKVYVKIINLNLHVCCQPQNYYRFDYIQTKNVRFLHVPCDPSKNEKCRVPPPLLTDIGPHCACTMQVGGAQRRLVVHNVALTNPRKPCRPWARIGHMIMNRLLEDVE